MSRIRLLVGALLLLAYASSAEAVITVNFTDAEQPGQNGGASAQINTTTGCTITAIVMMVTWYNSVTTTPTISDSASNTYTAGTQYDSNLESTRIWYVLNPTTSATHTFSVTGNSSYPGFHVYGLCGTATSMAFDQETGADNHLIAGTSLATGSITPSENNEIVMSMVGFYANTTSVSNNQSLTQTDTSYVMTVGQALSSGYKVQGAAAAINVTWSWTNSEFAAVTIFSIKAAAGGGGTDNSSLMLRGVGR